MKLTLLVKASLLILKNQDAPRQIGDIQTSESDGGSRYPEK